MEVTTTDTRAPVQPYSSTSRVASLPGEDDTNLAVLAVLAVAVEEPKDINQP